jgi:hypothetical protein
VNGDPGIRLGYPDRRLSGTLGILQYSQHDDGAWFLSKSGSGRDNINHPQDLNLLTSTTNMDDAKRKLIQRCSRVIATPSTAMRLDNIVTGEK